LIFCLRHCLFALFFLLIPRPSISTLFPYTTLFRSSALSKRSASPEFPANIEVISVSSPDNVSPVIEVKSKVSAEPSPSITGETRSEEHTSELQSRFDLVCRLLLEKKKKQIKNESAN